MKRLGLFLVICGMAFVNVVSGSAQKKSQLPFPTNFDRLTSYLDLSLDQLEEVYEINEFFIDQQRKYLKGKSSPEQMEKDFHQVLFGNLKLMRETLTQEQYRKYLVLINVTNSNRLMDSATPDYYYALKPANDSK